mmetsp:Transcript_20862/g.51723  ORF Transcript_20862/g.51723 Transcript_20862/m.51723 type:complete len:221 (-) Transcript_20862:3286-3948(-)
MLPPMNTTRLFLDRARRLCTPARCCPEWGEKFWFCHPRKMLVGVTQSLDRTFRSISNHRMLPGAVEHKLFWLRRLLLVTIIRVVSVSPKLDPRPMATLFKSYLCREWDPKAPNKRVSHSSCGPMAFAVSSKTRLFRWEMGGQALPSKMPAIRPLLRISKRATVSMRRRANTFVPKCYPIAQKVFKAPGYTRRQQFDTHLLFWTAASLSTLMPVHLWLLLV